MENFLAGVCLSALAVALVPSPVLADGGDGRGYSGSVGGLGGTDGTLAGATGQDGQAYGGTGGGAGTGGGGGVDLTTGNGAPGGSRGTYGPGIVSGTKGATGATGLTAGASTAISTVVSGGEGGDGAADVPDVSTDGGGGGGGAGVRATADVTVTGAGIVTGGAGGSNPNAGGGGGGVGVFSSADVTVEAGGQVTGGAGGGSGDRNSPDRTQGGGGGGAAAIVLTDSGTLQNGGTLTGGAGGGSVLAGGGDGGAAVQLLDGGTVINADGGTIIGGAGGAGRAATPSSGPPTSPGAGGAGIKGANLAVINGGTIAGGAGGTGSGWTPIAGQAILFTGGMNSLEIWSTSNIVGNVTAFSAADTFKLGGETDGIFDLSEIGAGAKYDGFGFYEKVGAGTWNLTGATAAVPLWTIRDGTLQVDIVIDSDVDVMGGTLAGSGTVGNTANFAGGTIAPGNGGIGTLTIDGNYTGNGGALQIEAELGDDGSPSDLLVITGNSVLTGGATQVVVTNLGGAGAETTGDGIKIIDVAGASAAGAFVLGGPAIGGAYTYNLFQNGIADPTDGDWYLRAAGLAPTVPVYENYPIVMLGMTELPTLQQRVGDRYWPGAADDAAGHAGPRNLWTRIEGAHRHVDGDSTTGASYDSNRFLLQAGIDGLLVENGSGMLIGGFNAQYGRVDADISSDLGGGDNSTDSYGIGATLTWYGNDGVYADGQASVARLSSDLAADGAGEIADGNDGVGYAFSIEAGRRIAVGGSWSVTPQAQFAYTSVDFDDFTDPFGATVSLDSGDSLKGRIGVALDHDAADAGSRRHVYGIANLTYEFLDGTAVDVAGTEIAFEPDSFGAELGLGGTYRWAGGKYALYGEALASTSFEGSYGFKGTLGFSTAF